MRKPKAWAPTPTPVISAPPSKAPQSPSSCEMAAEMHKTLVLCCFRGCLSKKLCVRSGRSRQTPADSSAGLGRAEAAAWRVLKMMLTGHAPPNPADLVPWVTLPQDASVLKCCQNDDFFFFLFPREVCSEEMVRASQCCRVLPWHWSNCCYFLW